LGVFYKILYLVFILLLSIIIAFLLYFNLKCFFICLINKVKKHHKFKFRFKHKIYHIREARFIKPVDFVKWVLLDLIGGKDYLRLFGIWAFTGYYGEGKTMGALMFAKNMQKNYPHRNIKIFSNINIVGQMWVYPVVPCDLYGHCKFKHEPQKLVRDWREILNLPKNSIYIYDESQSDYSCNMGANAFPDDLLRRITQVRKKQFAMFMTSPKYNRMNINIRESVNFVIECRNRFQLDRWFSYTFYRAEDYEDYRENKVKLFMNKYLSMSFVVQNKDYRQYNTIEEVESIKREDDVKLKKNDGLMLHVELNNFRVKFKNEIIKEINEKLKKVV
jgi:hypothetical protein